jgi:hypothetical protein
MTNALAGLLLCGVLASTVPAAQAADRTGKFAALGAGVATCGRFLEARDAKNKEYFMLGGWVDGYLTARNQTDPDTFTLVPWQSTDMLAGLLAQYCRKHPEVAFMRATMIMAEALRPHRLKEASERVTVSTDSSPHKFFRETVVRIQQKLAKAGYYKGPTSGEFDQSTAAALKRFQHDKSIAVSGFPDQLTLLRLFE